MMSSVVKRMAAGPAAARTARVPLEAGFRVPSHDLADLLGSLGVVLFPRQRTLVQYVVWSVETGLIDVMHQSGSVSLEEASALTPLTVGGADALLGILCSLGLARRAADGRYSLTSASREYLLRESAFFIADHFAAVGYPIPAPYLKRRAGWMAWIKLRLLGLLPMLRYGTRPRIENQHTRNLAACAAAVRTGEFEDANRIVDIAGGSGVFAIPLLLEYPHKRVVLTELPQALPNIRPILAAHGVDDRVELRAMDVFRFPWDIPACDGIFMGNFVHGFTDEWVVRICREAFDRLPDGGRIWLHEALWNENRDGPLITALWHACMKSAGQGGQRTGREWIGLLKQVGFVEARVVPTQCAFGLVVARKVENSQQVERLRPASSTHNGCNS